MSAVVQSSVGNNTQTPVDAPVNENDQSSKHQHGLKILCKRKFDVAVVCVVIIVIWVLLALPTIFYLIPKVSNTSSLSPLYPSRTII